MLRRYAFARSNIPNRAQLSRLAAGVPTPPIDLLRHIDSRQLEQVVAPIVAMAKSTATNVARTTVTTVARTTATTAVLTATTTATIAAMAQRRVAANSATAATCMEWPTEAMSLDELLELRRMCLASSAAYTLARQGARAVERFVEDHLPGFHVDLRRSNDDHVLLVNQLEKIAYLSCRGTCAKHAPRKKRDVTCYLTILATHFNVDPKDDPRIVGTVAAAREAIDHYQQRHGYSFRCVGHSLGGFAATICAQELDCGATNFNGPVYRPYSKDTNAERADPAPTPKQQQQQASDATSSSAALYAALGKATSVVPPLPQIFPPTSTVTERKGQVHHLQLGNDVVSLVGGAQPYECEKYTRLRYDGASYDVAGAHYRDNIIAALEREIHRAAVAAGVDPASVLTGKASRGRRRLLQP